MTKPMTENKRARHFWLEPLNEVEEIVHRDFSSVRYKAPEQLIHVIEYSEVERLEKEAKEDEDKMKRDLLCITELESKLHDLEQDNADLKSDHDLAMRKAQREIEILRKLKNEYHELYNDKMELGSIHWQHNIDEKEIKAELEKVK